MFREGQVLKIVYFEPNSAVVTLRLLIKETRLHL